MANVDVGNEKRKCPRCGVNSLIPVSPTHLCCTLCGGAYNANEVLVAERFSSTIDFSKAHNKDGDN